MPSVPTLHPLGAAAAVRLLRSLLPSDPVLWLEADALDLPAGASVSVWPDSSSR